MVSDRLSFMLRFCFFQCGFISCVGGPSGFGHLHLELAVSNWAVSNYMTFLSAFEAGDGLRHGGQRCYWWSSWGDSRGTEPTFRYVVALLFAIRAGWQGWGSGLCTDRAGGLCVGRRANDLGIDCFGY